MPRRRFSANSPIKHDQSVTADGEEQIVPVYGTEVSTITPANNVQGIKVIKNNSKGDNPEALNQEELSGSECENGGRERSQSTSSSSESRKNRSLEALFQVTDTELKAISKQGPVIGHQYVTMDNHADSLIVVDSAIQDREELIGDTEIVQDEVTKAGQFLEESMKDIDNDDEEIEDADAALCHESALHLIDTESAALDESPVLIEETPKWRQFKNIERILQKAGIDTSSKTWLTLTRPGRHICPYCQRACSKPSVLEKHIRAHTGERPYPCLVCGFSFKTKSNLYKHCKSRAHSMKSNIEMKKMQLQGLSDYTGTEIETKTDDLPTDGDVEKRKNEPAQRHVIQEVMKYLEKDKCQRPNEVQTERQRAKLERLKSMQEKGLVEVKKREDPKIIHRQLSLPILPTSHFQKIAPKVDCVNLDTRGEVTYLAKVIVPGINQNELELEPVSGEVRIGADHMLSDSNLQTEWKNNIAVESPAYFDQIEIVNLPNSNSDPEIATKALQDLEELSDKFATVAQDGGHLTVHSLPDDRVQVILQLKCNESTLSANSTIQAMSFSEPEISSQSVPTTPVLSRGALSSAFLKERIQRLILMNAAIIDTPKVDPPRAKCVKVKRNLSRQDSDIAQIPTSSVAVTSVPGFIFPTITSVPLQPLPLDTENNNRTANIETQSTNKIGETFIAYKEREAHRVALNGSTGIRQSKSVIVEKMEYEGEHLMVLDPDRSEDESSMHKDEIKMVFNEATPDIYSPSVLTNSSNLTQILPSEVGMLAQKSRPGFELPLKSIFPQHSTVACMPTQTSLLQKVFLESQNQPMTSSVNSCTLPNFTISPMSTNVSTSTAQSPGYYGKMTLKNLQFMSKGLAHDISTPDFGLKMPLASPSVSAVTHLVGQQQYIVHLTPLTPSTAAAQFLLPSQSTSSVPVFVVGDSNLTSPLRRSQAHQQTIVLQPQDNQDVQQTVLNYVQSPSQVPAKQVVYPIQVVQRHPIMIQPQLQKSCSSTFMTGSPVLVKASETGSQITHTPLLLQSPVTSDPMKILSKIVSNTVNQQAAGISLGNVQVSKAKEIKIEIKLPPQQQLPQQLASPLTPSISRPTLKHQGKVQTPTTTLPYVFPVFRFRNVSLKSVGSETPVTTEHTTFQVQIDSSKANSATYLSTTQTLPISVSQDKLKSSFSSGSLKPESSLPQRNKVNVSLAKNNLMFNECSSKMSFDAGSNKCTGLFICSSCGIVFKKQETLDLHKMCYCTKSRDKVGIKNQALEATDLQMGDLSKEIITKLFQKSLSSSSHLNVQTESTKPEVMSVKVTIGSSCVSGITVTNEIVKHSAENVIKPGVITSTASELSLPSLYKSPKVKQDILSPVTQLRKETLGCDEGRETTSVTGKTVKEMLNNLKRQILKRKLKGKLMMKRSLSVDNVAAKQEMRYSDINLYTEPPLKRSRLMQSLENLEAEGISLKSTVFRRSESVPELSKEKLDEDVVMNDDSEELDIKQIPQGSPAHVHVSVKTAELILHPAAAPIYQQNFKMKSFPGIGTPPQLMPSDILRSNLELIDIDVTKKEFSFDQGEKQDSSQASECLVKSLKKLPVAVKIDTLNDPGKVTDTLQPVSAKSPKLGKARNPLFCQMSLVGHKYPSLRSLTHLTFCTVDRLQPCYVKLDKKVSMYSDWRICEQNKKFLGLPTRALLSLYDSHYTTDPVWVKNCGSSPNGGVVTHSSYWKYKHEQGNMDGIMEKIEDLIKKHSLEKVGIQGGFKTTESYVYVRGRGRGKYVCDTCGIRCKKPSMLKKHIRTHTNLRPYKCKHCKFSFKTKGNLTKHMKSRSHHKKCAELGISPVPTSIDESQIDEEALHMQFVISKQAKILDKASKKVVELVDTNECMFDENDSGECIDNDPHVDETMDGEDNEEDIDDNMENIEEDDADSLKLSKQDVEYGVPECIPPLPDMPTPSVTQTQHNLFLQTLGIIAKHQLIDDNAVAVPLSVSWQSTSNAFPIQASSSVNHVPISMSGTQSLALQSTSSLCSVGTSLTLLCQSDALMSNALLKKSNCLSTVYGSFMSKQGSPTSVTKHSDVILGLLRLSSQSKTTTEVTASGNQVDGVSQMTDKVVTSLDGKPIAIGTFGLPLHGIMSSLSTQVYIPLGGNEPPFRNTLASSDWLTKQCSSERGPIVGQIIQSVGALLKSDDSNKQQKEAVFLPFQFLHPFPGSMIMSSATSMTSAVKPSFSTDSFELHNNNHIDLTSDTENESHTKLATDYIDKVSDACGSTNQNAQAENMIQPIHIVNFHPNLFESCIVQKSLGVNVTQISLDKSSIFVKSLPDLNQSLNKSITNSLTSISAGRQCNSLSTNIKEGNLCHVTGTSGMVTESGSNGRFMCTICRACFPEHHQLFLHGNVHLLEHVKMKCKKCNLTFRSHYAYEKHLHSDLHAENEAGEVIIATSENPRPFKCQPCETAFRTLGHLTKHFRSRVHFKNFENTGRLPGGTWELLEHCLSELDVNSVDRFLVQVNELLNSLGHSEHINRSELETIAENEEVNDVFVENNGTDLFRVKMNMRPFESIAEDDTNGNKTSSDTSVNDADINEPALRRNSPTTCTESSEKQTWTPVCSLCGIEFADIMHLKDHVISHVELRPYVCDCCDAGFTNILSLKKHMHSHAQEVPHYLCGICGYKFSDSSALADHCHTLHTTTSNRHDVLEIGTQEECVVTVPTCEVALTESKNGKMDAIQKTHDLEIMTVVPSASDVDVATGLEDVSMETMTTIGTDVNFTLPYTLARDIMFTRVAYDPQLVDMITAQPQTLTMLLPTEGVAMETDDHVVEIETSDEIM